MKHQFCPICNHQLSGSFDYTSKIRTLLAKRSDRTKKLIRKVVSTIQKHNNDDVTTFSSYKFLQRLHDVEDEKIRRTIEQFLHGNYAQKMYGLKYLTGWILNLDSIYDKKKAIEQKMYGNPPKKRVITYEPVKTNAHFERYHKSNNPALDKLRNN